MLNQNSSILSNFSKVIIFLQPSYDRECQKIKEDLINLCQNKNLDLIEIIESKDFYDKQALCRLVELVNDNIISAPITVIISDDIIATPGNTILWAALGVLTAMKLITVTAFDYDYIDHEGIFLDDSNLKQDLLGISTAYFETYRVRDRNKNYISHRKYLEQLNPKPILFLLPPHNKTSQGLKNKQLIEEVTSYCEKNNLGILKTIKSNGSFDHRSFCELVRRVANWHYKPVMVIIDQLILHTSINKIFWAVLGTLRTAGLITISTYAKVNNELVIRQLNKHDNRFIHEATIYAKKFEVYEHYDSR